MRGANKARVGVGDSAASKMSKLARDEDASLPQQPRRKRLGASDIEVCEVCLGTMTFGSMTADEATFHHILDPYSDHCMLVCYSWRVCLSPHNVRTCSVPASVCLSAVACELWPSVPCVSFPHNIRTCSLPPKR